MLADLVGIFTGIALFPLFLLAPGYAIAGLTDLLGFRRSSLNQKLGLSLLISIAICPIATYLLSRFGSFVLVWIAYGAAWAVVLTLLVKSVWEQRRSSLRLSLSVSRSTVIAGAIALAWVLFAVASLIDIQVGHRLYFSVVDADHAARAAVTDAITRTGVPPANPSYFPGRPVPLYYYYFWPLLCSLADRLGGPLVSARQAVIAGACWAGLALMAVIAIYLQQTRRFDPGRGRRAILISLGLLLVSGLDIVPAGLIDLLQLLTVHKLAEPDIERWNTQVTAWLGAMLWVPHHVAGLVACLTVLLFARLYRTARSRGERMAILAVCAAGLASALGLSIWIAFVFATFIAVWMSVCLVARWYDEALLWIAIGAFGALLAAPFLLDLRRANQLGGLPLAFSVRSFTIVDAIVRALGVSNGFAAGAIDAIVLPLNYFLELGFFALAGLVWWRQVRRSGSFAERAVPAEVALLATSMALATFLRSDVTAVANNDLGWRGIMPAQFVLLIWAADVLCRLEPRPPALAGEAPLVLGRGLIVCLILGLATVVYDVATLRTYPILVDAGIAAPVGWIAPQAPIGPRAYALHDAYRWIAGHSSGTAVIQHNPAVAVDLYQGLYGDRQAAASDEYNGPLYGIPVDRYRAVEDGVAPIFSDAAIDVARVGDICHRYGIDVLVVQDIDPVWSADGSWVAKREPLYQNARVKVFSCG